MPTTLEPCPHCKSTDTIKLESCTACNNCDRVIDETPNEPSEDWSSVSCYYCPGQVHYFGAPVPPYLICLACAKAES